MSLQVCLLGFGEVGQALAVDFAARGVSGLVAWDILFPVADSAPRRASTAKGVRAAASVEDATATADLVVSAVTAAPADEARKISGGDVSVLELKTRVRPSVDRLRPLAVPMYLTKDFTWVAMRCRKSGSTGTVDIVVRARSPAAK